MERTLTLSTGNFDQINTFGLEVAAYNKQPITIKCSLRRGYEKEGDGVYWAMKHSAMVKDSYSADDFAEGRRVFCETPVKHGDTVMIDGAAYRVKVAGNFSDAAIFEKI